MKQFWIIFNCFLLAFEPSVFALSKPQQNQVKEFFESTGIGSREVPLKEYFEKIKVNLPEGIRRDLQAYVEANPNMVLPKMSVSKVGPSNQEDIQVSFIANDGNNEKTSASFVILGRENAFAQVGNVKISNEDLQDLRQLSGKLETALPGPKTKMVYRAKNFQILSAGEINLLSLNERRVYFKHLRDLLGSMEKTENARYGFKDSAPSAKNEIENFRTFILSNIIPEAEAKYTPGFNDGAVKNIKLNDSANSCIYAGYVTNYGYKIDGETYDPKRDKRPYHYACGGPSSGMESLRTKITCSKGGIRCNPSVYGMDPEICVAENSRDATSQCNQKSDKYDAFPKGELKGDDRAAFDALKAAVMKKLEEQKKTCKEVAENPQNRLEDQVATCQELSKRIAEIEATTCEMAAAKDDKEGAVNHEKRKAKFASLKCEKVAQPQPPAPGPGGQPGGADGACPKPVEKVDQPCPAPGPGPQPPPTTNPPTPPSPQAGSCDPSKFNKDPGYVKSVNANCAQHGGRVESCTDKEKETWVGCSCPAVAKPLPYGAIGLAYDCIGGNNSGGTSSGSGKPPGRGSSSSSSSGFTWKPWMTQAAVGLFAIGVGYWLMKGSLKSQFSLLTPSPTATPVPSSTIAPATRGAR